MAISIIQQPAAVVYSDNPVIVRVSTTLSSYSSLTYSCKIYRVISSVNTLIAELLTKPDSSGRGTFNISEIIKPYCSNIYSEFRIEVAEVTGETAIYGTPAYYNFYSVKGKFIDKVYPDYFNVPLSSLYVEPKAQVSNIPVLRYISSSDFDIINIFSTSAGSIYAKITFYLSNGYTQNLNYYLGSVTSQKGIWSFDLLFETILSFATADVSYIILYIEKNSTRITDDYRYIVQHNFPLKQQFKFKSMLGGNEILRTTGRIEKNIQAEKELLSIDKAYNYNRLTGEHFSVNRGITEIYKINTGGFRSKELLEPYAELLYSNEVYFWDNGLPEIANNKWLKIIILTDSFRIYKDDEGLFFLEFEFRSTFTDL